MDKENIAVLVGRYIPKPSPNGICIDSIISNIDKEKFNVTVFCYEDFLTSEKNDIRIIRIKRDIINSSLYKKQNVNKTSFILPIFAKLKEIILLPIWPLSEPHYVKKLLEALEIENGKNPFKYLICAYNPLASLIAGYKFKNNHPNVNYIAYLLDSFIGGHLPRFLPKKFLFWRRKKWQNKVLSNCDKIVAMKSSEKFEIQYNKDQPFFDKYLFLDIPLLSNKQVSSFQEKENHESITVTFCGNIQYPYRNIKYLFEIIKNISNPKIRFLFIGDTNFDPLKEDALPNVQYLPYLPHEKLKLYMEESKIFLNLGVKNANTISGKIFEYAGYGKPIISTFGIDDEPCIKYLKKYPRHLLIDERLSDCNKQAKIMEKFILENYKYRIPFSDISKIYEDSMPETFVKECIK